MERKAYLELCKRNATLRTVRGVAENEATRRKLCVSYKGNVEQQED